MKTTVFVAVCTVCLMLFGTPTNAQRKAHQRFTLILDFNTCVSDPNDASIIVCQEKDGTGKPVGQIKVTYLGPRRRRRHLFYKPSLQWNLA